eukprot:scaffold172352_cov24-Tisochrysis_lutea.AAC.1
MQGVQAVRCRGAGNSSAGGLGADDLSGRQCTAVQSRAVAQSANALSYCGVQVQLQVVKCSSGEWGGMQFIFRKQARLAKV